MTPLSPGFTGTPLPPASGPAIGAGQASTWVVTRQVPDQYDFTSPGDPVLGVIVHFVTGLGEEGSVFVAAARYHPDTVRVMIAAKAALIDAVAQLTSGS